MASKKQLELRIKSLEKQLSDQFVGGILCSALYGVSGPTIRGKVDAIAEHLGLEFDIKPGQSAKVTAKKRKK